MATGSSFQNGYTLFEDSHILTTNLGGPILYTNEFIIDGTAYFGASTNYFTSTAGQKTFLLGAQLNGISFLQSTILNAAGTPTCTPFKFMKGD